MAVKLGDIMALLEGAAPLCLQEPWDNTGLAVGDPEALVDHVLIGLDVTEAFIQEARQIGATLLLTHHPLLFTRPDAITPATPQGKKILALIQSGLNVYSAHTNLDKATGGLNDLIMECLGYTKAEPLEAGVSEGIGRIADIGAIPLEDLARQIAASLGQTTIRYCGRPDRLIHKVAVINGGGADFITAARIAGADCVITGDTKYHEVLDALEAGTAVIDPGHFATEWPVFKLAMAHLEEKIRRELGEVRFTYAKSSEDPYQVISL